RLNSIPINFVQLRQVTAILEKERARIRERKRPTPVILSRPSNCRMQITLQMDNWFLSTAIGKRDMVGLMDQVEHDGTRSEVDRPTFTYILSGVARRCHLVKPALLDAIHADGGSVRRAPHYLLSAPQVAIGTNRREAGFLHNVV